MKVAPNIGNCPGPTPGSDKAVNAHKGYAMNVNAPASERRVKVDLAGSSTGATRVPGLSGRK